MTLRVYPDILAAIMAVTQEDIDALNQAIIDGVRSVTIGGQTTLYNTTESLIKARDDARSELLRLQTRAGRRYNRRTLLSYAGRGYNNGGGYGNDGFGGGTV